MLLSFNYNSQFTYIITIFPKFIQLNLSHHLKIKLIILKRQVGKITGYVLDTPQPLKIQA